MIILKLVTVVCGLLLVSSTTGRVYLLDDNDQTLRRTRSPTSTFGPKTFNITATTVRADFYDGCSAVVGQLPDGITEGIVVVSLLDALGELCEKPSLIMNGVLSAARNMTVLGVIFVRGADGAPEQQSHHVNLIPGGVWLLEEDTGAERVRVPSVTIRMSKEDTIFPAENVRVRMLSGDESEWNTFYDSTVFQVFKIIDHVISVGVGLICIYGIRADKKRHHTTMRNLLKSVPIVVQLLLLCMVVANQILPELPSKTRSFLPPLISFILKDLGLVCAVQALCVFYRVWDEMVETFKAENSPGNAKFTFIRYRALSLSNFAVWLAALLIRVTKRQAKPNRLASNILNGYLGLIILVVCIQSAGVGVKISSWAVSSFAVGDLDADARNPFQKMITTARRLIAVTLFLLVVEVGTLFVINWNLLIYHKTMRWVVRLFFLSFEGLLLTHLQTARTNNKRLSHRVDSFAA